MIFGRDRKRKDDADDDEAAAEADETTEATEARNRPTPTRPRPTQRRRSGPGGSRRPRLARRRARRHRRGRRRREHADERPRIDLGSMVLTGLPGVGAAAAGGRGDPADRLGDAGHRDDRRAPAGARSGCRPTPPRWSSGPTRHRAAAGCGRSCATRSSRRHRGRRLGSLARRPVRGRAAPPDARDHPRRRAGLPAVPDVGGRGSALAAPRHRLRPGRDRGRPRVPGRRRPARPRSARSSSAVVTRPMAPGDLLPLHAGRPGVRPTNPETNAWMASLTTGGMLECWK